MKIYSNYKSRIIFSWRNLLHSLLQFTWTTALSSLLSKMNIPNYLWATNEIVLFTFLLMQYSRVLGRFYSKLISYLNKKYIIKRWQIYNLVNIGDFSFWNYTHRYAALWRYSTFTERKNIFILSELLRNDN